MECEDTPVRIKFKSGAPPWKEEEHSPDDNKLRRPGMRRGIAPCRKDFTHRRMRYKPGLAGSRTVHQPAMQERFAAHRNDVPDSPQQAVGLKYDDPVSFALRRFYSSPDVAATTSEMQLTPSFTRSRAEPRNVSIPSLTAMFRMSSSFTSSPASKIALRMAGEKYSDS